MKRLFYIGIFYLLLCMTLPLQAKIGNKLTENEKQYGKDISTRQFSDDKKNFSGKVIYQFPLHGWQVESIYRDGKSFSETIRPKGSKVNKKLLTEKEASSIASISYPREDRGLYRKQVKNAHFISHFYDNGVVSLEMKLDSSRKKHTGVIGVRCIKYSDGETFSKIKVGAYH